MKTQRIRLAAILVFLIVIIVVLFKLNRAQNATSKVSFSKNISVFTGKVEAIQDVVVDTETGGYDTRLVSTEGNEDRFSIPSKMKLVVGKSYKFTVKNDHQPGTYPRAVDAVQK